MGYKFVIDKHSGFVQLLLENGIFHLKEDVNTYNSLPTIGNVQYDLRYILDTGDAYYWSILSPSGLLTDWIKIEISSEGGGGECECEGSLRIEFPAQVNSKRFRLSELYYSGKLLVFLNGLQEKEIVEINDTDFEFKIDISPIIDTVRVQYIVKDSSYNLLLEIPSKVNSKRFQTSEDFITTKLLIFLNGVQEKEITIIDDNTFEFKIDTEVTDSVYVQYVQKF